MADTITSMLADLQAYLFGPAFVFSPVYIPSTVLIAFLVWRVGSREESFIRYLVPRSIYRHPSTWVDIKLSAFNLLFLAPGILSLSFLAPTVTYGLLELLNGQAGTVHSEDFTWARGITAAVILFLSEDFTRYINHYLHHKSRLLWPFHAVHHSAEVLTPFSFQRSHPVYYMLQRVMVALMSGTIQAGLLFLIVGHIDFWMLYFSILAFQIYVFLGAHLRHSHIRLSYGRILEHILISPAQHQIHHSVDPQHYNKNLGEIFAIWDWMFGTLYIPDGKEVLRFGVGDLEGNPVPQPYPTLRDALLKPFAESAAVLRKTPLVSAPPGTGPAPVNDER